MKPVKIVLGSVLKPLKDPRMYKKFGLSLSELPGTVIHIAGFGDDLAKERNICFHSIFKSSRLSLSRFLVPLRFLFLLIKLRPNIVIACTFELLPAAVFYKIFSGCKIIYDVQENYFKNVRYTTVFPGVIRPFLASFIRLTERICTPFITLFIAAEKCYPEEMPFIRKKSVIIENKYFHDGLEPAWSGPVFVKEKMIRFIYTGTISEDYGIFDALNLLFRIPDKLWQLTIAGFAAKQEDFQKLEHLLKNRNNIRLIGGAIPVDHEIIIENLRNEDVALLPYRITESTQNRIPTKIYECMANMKPMIIQKNSIWEKLDTGNFALFIDYKSSDPCDLINQIHQTEFYTKAPEYYSWDSEKIKLQNAIKKISTAS